MLPSRSARVWVDSWQKFHMVLILTTGLLENFWRKINSLPKLIVKLGLEHLIMISNTGWVPLIYLTIIFIILETGSGNTETLQFNGLIGPMVNPTTSNVERTV